MKNPFRKETFEFSEEQLTIFKEFLRSAMPLVLVNWKRDENRPKFPGMPGYKLLGILEDYEGTDEATSSIHAVFENNVGIPGIGSGNVIWLKSFYGVEQVFIAKYAPDNIFRYLLYVKHHEHIEKYRK